MRGQNNKPKHEVTTKQMPINTFTRTGLYHKQLNKENEDRFCSAQDERYLVIALADGVSTCEMSGTGAEIAAKEITKLFFQKAEFFFGFTSEQIAGFALAHVLYELQKRADQDKKPLKDYSSTLASVLYDKETKKLLYFSLGDGVIFASERGKCSILTPPADSSRGCPVTTTKGAQKHVTARIVDAKELDSVMICSDGAWTQMVGRSRILPWIAEAIGGSDYGKITTFLSELETEDDCSCITLIT